MNFFASMDPPEFPNTATLQLHWMPECRAHDQDAIIEGDEVECNLGVPQQGRLICSLMKQ